MRSLIFKYTNIARYVISPAVYFMHTTFRELYPSLQNSYKTYSVAPVKWSTSLFSTVTFRNVFYLWNTPQGMGKLNYISRDIFRNIILIIWHYNTLWVFSFSAKSLQVLLPLAASFQFLTFSFFRSSMTSSCHRCLGLPTGLVPTGFQSSGFLVGLAWSLLWICPNHLILCALTL